MNVNDLWVAEYSVDQGAFHVHQVRDAVAKNLSLCLRGQYNGYVPVAISETREGAEKMIQAMRALFVGAK